MVYKAGDHVLYNGKERIVINKHGAIYTLDDGTRVNAGAVETIDGYDYSKCPDKLKVGDVVRVTAQVPNINYGALFCNEQMIKYYGRFARVTCIVEPSTKCGNYVYLDITDDKWVWSGLMVEKIQPKELHVGDLVLHNDSIREVQRIMEDISGKCIYIVSGDHLTPNRTDLTFVDKVKVKLTSDVYGIGSKDDVITAYKKEYGDEIVAGTDGVFFGELAEDEYELVV